MATKRKRKAGDAGKAKASRTSKPTKDPKALKAGHVKLTLSLPAAVAKALKHAAVEHRTGAGQIVAMALEADPRVRRFLD